jgi:hypothetical protein
VGIGTAVGVVMGGPAVIEATGARKQLSNRQSDSGPTRRLTSYPEAGPGDTVGTQNQGYLSVFWVRPHTRGCPSRCFRSRMVSPTVAKWFVPDARETMDSVYRFGPLRDA